MCPALLRIPRAQRRRATQDTAAVHAYRGSTKTAEPSGSRDETEIDFDVGEGARGGMQLRKVYEKDQGGLREGKSGGN